MKYVGTLLILGVLVWTWKISQKPQPVAQEIHEEIQRQLKTRIQKHILTQKPQAKDIKFDSVWTKSINKNTLKAQFKYSYKEGLASKTTTQLQGYGILKRQADNNTWLMNEFHILDQSVSLEEGLSVVLPESP